MGAFVPILMQIGISWITAYIWEQHIPANEFSMGFKVEEHLKNSIAEDETLKKGFGKIGIN